MVTKLIQKINEQSENAIKTPYKLELTVDETQYLLNFADFSKVESSVKIHTGFDLHFEVIGGQRTYYLI